MEAWEDPEVRPRIEDNLRYPGGKHEWLVVARAPVFKLWGLTLERVRELRNAIPDVFGIILPGGTAKVVRLGRRTKRSSRL